MITKFRDKARGLANDTGEEHAIVSRGGQLKVVPMSEYREGGSSMLWKFGGIEVQVDDLTDAEARDFAETLTELSLVMSEEELVEILENVQ